jgi:hypothetical protein
MARNSSLARFWASALLRAACTSARWRRREVSVRIRRVETACITACSLFNSVMRRSAGGGSQPSAMPSVAAPKSSVAASRRRLNRKAPTQASPTAHSRVAAIRLTACPAVASSSAAGTATDAVQPDSAERASTRTSCSPPRPSVVTVSLPDRMAWRRSACGWVATWVRHSRLRAMMLASRSNTVTIQDGCTSLGSRVFRWPASTHWSSSMRRRSARGSVRRRAAPY